MNEKRYIDSLIFNQSFHFGHLAISGIDNAPVAKIFSDNVLEQEFCLFAHRIQTGDSYCQFLHQKVVHALQNRQPLPVARFADGEYAFYKYTLNCNGLYKQAESIEKIRDVMPQHVSAMQYLSNHGLLAPLVYPGNSNIATSGFLSLLKKRLDSSGAEFLEFLHTHHISVTADNYIPFYVVYAYLSSAEFAEVLNGKNICILNSEYNKESCLKWFAKLGSSPTMEFVDIPQEYVATQWEQIKAPILNKIPASTDLCLVGAGVGALLICKDVAQLLSIPAIDAGHVLNMMNDRVDKSNGVRLYTLRK
jgi:hypothetical protein